MQMDHENPEDFIHEDEEEKYHQEEDVDFEMLVDEITEN